MNSQSGQNLEPHLQQSEAELNSATASATVILPTQKLQPLQTENSLTKQPRRGQFLNWFNSLPDLGKLLVIGIAAIVGIAILQAVLKIVAAVISLTILAVLLYMAYQFFIGRSAEIK